MATVSSLSCRGAFASARLARPPRNARLAARSATRGFKVASMSGFYDLSAKDIDGNVVSFDRFKGKVVLITNVASA